MRKMEEIIKQITTERWKAFDPLEKQIIILVANLERCSMKDLIEFTKKNRVTIQKRLKNLIPDVITEVKTSDNDPQKYYTL